MSHESARDSWTVLLASAALQIMASPLWTFGLVAGESSMPCVPNGDPHPAPATLTACYNFPCSLSIRRCPVRRTGECECGADRANTATVLFLTSSAPFCPTGGWQCRRQEPALPWSASQATRRGPALHRAVSPVCAERGRHNKWETDRSTLVRLHRADIFEVIP